MRRMFGQEYVQGDGLLLALMLHERRDIDAKKQLGFGLSHLARPCLSGRMVSLSFQPHHLHPFRGDLIRVLWRLSALAEP